MNLLLDTHTMLWAMIEPDKLSGAARSLLADPANELMVSISSLWETTIKIAIGKSPVPGSDIGFVVNNLDPFRIQILPIRPSHLRVLQDLPFFHKDPFDRILVAQAISEGMPLITTDSTLRNYAVETIWK
jgi:PIN domain nuclease of toxin-antitoxin system